MATAKVPGWTALPPQVQQVSVTRVCARGGSVGGRRAGACVCVCVCVGDGGRGGGSARSEESESESDGEGPGGRLLSPAPTTANPCSSTSPDIVGDPGWLTLPQCFSLARSRSVPHFLPSPPTPLSLSPPPSPQPPPPRPPSNPHTPPPSGHTRAPGAVVQADLARLIARLKTEFKRRELSLIVNHHRRQRPPTCRATTGKQARWIDARRRAAATAATGRAWNRLVALAVQRRGASRWHPTAPSQHSHSTFTAPSQHGHRPGHGSGYGVAPGPAHTAVRPSAPIPGGPQRKVSVDSGESGDESSSSSNGDGDGSSSSSSSGDGDGGGAGTLTPLRLIVALFPGPRCMLRLCCDCAVTVL